MITQECYYCSHGYVTNKSLNGASVCPSCMMDNDVAPALDRWETSLERQNKPMINQKCYHCKKEFTTPAAFNETSVCDHCTVVNEVSDALARWEKVDVVDHSLDTCHLPAANDARKNIPVATGFLEYFPDAILAVAELSRIGNDQHNPGEDLHWARDKSSNDADPLARHFIDRGKIDGDGVRHSTKVAWRAMALLQREIDGKP